MDNLDKSKNWASFLLRWGLAVVFILFGYQKLSIPEQTRAEIQLLLDIGLGSASAINFYLGLIEIMIAISFVLGIFIKKTSLLASLMLLGFFSSFLWKYGLGIDPTLYRDLGLLAGSLALWLLGSGAWSLDEWLSKRQAQLKSS